MVDFTNVTLAFKDANSKLLDVVSVADFDAKECADDSLVMILKKSTLAKGLGSVVPLAMFCFHLVDIVINFSH